MAQYELFSNVGWKESGDTLVVVSMQGGNYFILKGSAKFIFEKIVTHVEEQSIALSLSEHFNINLAQATKDLDQFIQQLMMEKIIHVK